MCSLIPGGAGRLSPAKPAPPPTAVTSSGASGGDITHGEAVRETR